MSVPLKESLSPRKGQVRILQIVESLHTGAVENWLYRVFSAVSANYPDYHWTFFCTSGKPGRLDEKVRGLGGEIIYSPYTIGERRAFFSSLRKVIKEGHYDVLHCHHDLVSAIYLCASLGIPLRKRIVHVHNTDECVLTPSPLKQFLLKEPMRQTCMHFADNIVGISKEALNKFIRGARLKPGRDQVVYYGIDTSVFRQDIPTPEQFRLDLGFSSGAKILVFVGRMVPLKNPCFVVDVLAALANMDPSVVAVFVGAGDLEATVRELAEQKQLQKRVRILGWRDDTATIMRLCDLLVFPRLEEPKEGLGLVLVEGQAAGLPIIASPSITKDVQVIPELFEIIPLAAGPEAWAERIHAMLSQKRLPRQRYLTRVEASSFSIIAGVSNLLSLYSDQN